MGTDPGRARLAKRALIALTSGAIAGGLAWAFLVSRRAPDAVELVEGAPERAPPHASRSNVSGRGAFALEPVDEATARRLFPRMSRGVVFDPFTYFRRRGGLEVDFEWPEHPDGSWVRRTNAAGLREDSDMTLAQTGLRILVTGDSHTDGVCNNDESFTNLLEANLSARFPERVVCALNTGLAGYSFYNYLGVLRKYADEGLDVFVVAVYGGNDFIDVLAPHHHFSGTQPPPGDPRYWDRIEEAKRVSTTFVAQGLNQVLYFREHPDQVDVALEAALVTAREMQRICDEQDARLVFVYIPPAFDVPWRNLNALRERAMEALGLTETDLAIAARLAHSFLDGLSDSGIEALDMGPRFLEEEAPCYWKRDLHIDLRGQALVADALEEWLLSDPASRPDRSPLVDGPFEERDEQGELLVRGAFEGGRRSGSWERWFPGGGRESSGFWVAGRREGTWRWWFEGERPKKVGDYRDGVPHGPCTEWYANGELRAQGRFEAGLPEGTWRQWHPDGTIAAEGEYRNGVQQGVWNLGFEGGAPDARLTYRDGVLHGPATKWFRRGGKAWEGRHEDGLRVGQWKIFWENGGEREVGQYVAGEHEGPWTFRTEDGSIDTERSGTYRRGKRVGERAPSD